MGAAQLQFYSSLVDLLGRCAPEAEAIKAGRSDSLRARAILRSLVSLEDLEGALGMRFILPVKKMEQVRVSTAEAGRPGSVGPALSGGSQGMLFRPLVSCINRLYCCQCSCQSQT